MSVLALNVDLAEQGKCETVFGGAKARELLLGPRLLLAAVVDGERQDLQLLAPVFLSSAGR